MWKCLQCGTSNNDDRDHCWKCSTIKGTYQAEMARQPDGIIGSAQDEPSQARNADRRMPEGISCDNSNTEIRSAKKGNTFLKLLVIIILIPVCLFLSPFVYFNLLHLWLPDTGYVDDIDLSERDQYIPHTSTTNYELWDYVGWDQYETAGTIEVRDNQFLSVSPGTIITNRSRFQSALPLTDYYGDRCVIPFGMTVAVNEKGVIYPVSYNPFLPTPPEVDINSMKSEIVGTWTSMDSIGWTTKFTKDGTIETYESGSLKLKGTYKFVDSYTLYINDVYLETNRGRSGNWYIRIVDGTFLYLRGEGSMKMHKIE